MFLEGTNFEVYFINSYPVVLAPPHAFFAFRMRLPLFVKSGTKNF